MTLFPLLLAVLPAPDFAQAASPRWISHVHPLQMHCGQQEIPSEGRSLAYGNLVFRGEDGKVQLARFEKISHEPAFHSFCPVLQEAMNQGRRLDLRVRPRPNFLELLELRISL